MTEDTAVAVETAQPSISNLPAIGAPWPGVDGIYAGITCASDGKPYALVLLNEKSDLNWRDGVAWAQGLGGELPNRVEGALCFANVREHFEQRWHWLSEQYSDGTAWDQDFLNGYQSTLGKSYEAACRAVRRFPL